MRSTFAKLHQWGQLNWMISPWKTTKTDGFLFDGLTSLKSTQDNTILAAFIQPPDVANLLWYELLLKEWRQWREKGGSLQPANLYIWRPNLQNQTVIDYLASKVRADNGNVVVFTGEELRKGKNYWHALTNHRVHTVPGVMLPQSAFAKNGFLKNYARHSTTYSVWVEKNLTKDVSLNTQRLLQISSIEIQILRLISLHPPATLERLKAISSTENMKRRMRKRVGHLEGLGLVQTLNDEEKTIIVTPAGLSFLGGVAGVPERLYAALLGWPSRPSAYSTQRGHYSRIMGFLQWLHAHKKIVHWHTLRCKYTYKDIALGSIKRRWITIHPDGEGDYLFSNGQYVKFWLEVDRGTRRGKKFTAQLERYYLIRYAAVSPVSIPALLYIVDTGSKKDENRLRSAAARLTDLAKTKYKYSTLVVLFTTGVLLDRCGNEDPGRTKNWRIFMNGELNPEFLSLEEGLRIPEKLRRKEQKS
jgi:hypothetical protein